MTGLSLDRRIEHPLRRALNDEVHARPPLRLSAPAAVFHFAWIGDRAIDPIIRLCTQYGEAAPTPDHRHGVIRHDDGWIKWEWHTEFVTCCFLRPDKVPASPWPNLPPDIAAFLAGLSPADPPSAGLASGCLVALCLRVEENRGGLPGADDLQSIFPSGDVVGSSIGAGDALVWTDFHLDEEGFGRILLRNIRETPGRLGRAVQRLVEVETYRMMALLGLPLAREASDDLVQLERRLTDIAARTADADQPADDHALLDQLTRIAAEAAALSARTRSRFSATAAYAQLVERRLEELREDRIDGLSRLSAFLERRFLPAMRTCESCVRRMDVLTASIDQAADMLRTRVDVHLEAQNSNLLRAMESRSRTQLRIQEAVEGLSVFAISYYLIGLLKTIAEGLVPDAWFGGKHLAAAIAVPIVLCAVWFAMRRLRRALTAEH